MSGISIFPTCEFESGAIREKTIREKRKGEWGKGCKGKKITKTIKHKSHRFFPLSLDETESLRPDRDKGRREKRR